MPIYCLELLQLRHLALTLLVILLIPLTSILNKIELQCSRGYRLTVTLRKVAGIKVVLA